MPLSSLTKTKYNQVTGEISTCANPWTISPDDTVFGFDNSYSGRQVAACSLMRNFEITSGTAVSLKTGTKLNFLVGFNEFASTKTVGPLAQGVTTTALTWKVTDRALRLITVVYAIAAIHLLI